MGMPISCGSPGYLGRMMLSLKLSWARRNNLQNSSLMSCLLVRTAPHLGLACRTWHSTRFRACPNCMASGGACGLVTSLMDSHPKSQEWLHRSLGQRSLSSFAAGPRGSRSSTTQLTLADPLCEVKRTQVESKIEPAELPESCNRFRWFLINGDAFRQFENSRSIPMMILRLNRTIH